MAKGFSLFLSFLFTGMAQAADFPNTPPNPCAGGCTEKMQEIWANFQTHANPPEMAPAVYSGDCYFLSRSYRPDHAHRSMVYIDQHPRENRLFFASGFHFFAKPDRYKDFTLESLRERVNDGNWKNFQTITVAENTARVVTLTNEGGIAWLYYMRQNPVTKNIYYITYWGGPTQISFCELTPNQG